MASGVGGPTGPRGPGKFPQEQPRNEGRVGDHTVSGDGPVLSSNPRSSSESNVADRVNSGAQEVLGRVPQQDSGGNSSQVGKVLQGIAQRLLNVFRKTENSLPQGTPPPDREPLNLEELTSRLDDLKRLEKTSLSETDRKDLEDLIKITEEQIAHLGVAQGSQMLQGASRLSSEDMESLTDQEVADIISQGEAARSSLRSLSEGLSPILQEANEKIDQTARGGSTSPTGRATSPTGSSSSKVSRSLTLTSRRICQCAWNILVFLLRVISRILSNIICALGNARRAAAEAFRRCCCCGDDGVSDVVSERGSDVASDIGSLHGDLGNSLRRWSGKDRVSSREASAWREGNPGISTRPADSSQEDPKDDDDRIYLQIEPENLGIRGSPSASNIDPQDQRNPSSSPGEEVVYESIDEVLKQGGPTPPPVPPRPQHTLSPTPEDLDALYAKPIRPSGPKTPENVKPQVPQEVEEEEEELPPPLPSRSEDLLSSLSSEAANVDPLPPLPPRPGASFPSNSEDRETIYTELSQDIYLPILPEQGRGSRDSDAPPVSPRESSEYENPLPRKPSDGDYDNLRSPPLPSRDSDTPPSGVSAGRRFLMGMSLPTPGGSRDYDWIRPEDVRVSRAASAPPLPPRPGGTPESLAVETSPGFGHEVAAVMLADAVEKTIEKMEAEGSSEESLTPEDLENIKYLAGVVKGSMGSSQGKPRSGEGS